MGICHLEGATTKIYTYYFTATLQYIHTHMLSWPHKWHPLNKSNICLTLFHLLFITQMKQEHICYQNSGLRDIEGHCSIWYLLIFFFFFVINSFMLKKHEQAWKSRFISNHCRFHCNSSSVNFLCRYLTKVALGPFTNV